MPRTALASAPAAPPVAGLLEPEGDGLPDAVPDPDGLPGEVGLPEGEDTRGPFGEGEDETVPLGVSGPLRFSTCRKLALSEATLAGFANPAEAKPPAFCAAKDVVACSPEDSKITAKNRDNLPLGMAKPRTFVRSVFTPPTPRLSLRHRCFA